ncbi:hypothetical protein KOAAANKH_01699 [Brevundimonas sp. NIBR10]|uniref:hypothetical protein n=1 Tax=Brevundimonas sp. NIBR10 TaxID=3015997 RepID=UPI0022F162D3|nr:hypothetical protein [Brevundimonas sp. NIBR10]WGM46825.1 hypothetical protein KOAAANKH_01699 [Brevundimonas sp. NIBR10]
MKTSSTALAISTGLLAGAAVAAAVFLAVASPTPAQAQVAARVESQTRPNFGLLLSPQTSSRPRREHRRFNYRDHRPDYYAPPRPGYGPGYPPNPGGLQNEVVVDCGGNPGSGGVEAAARRVAPGGTLTIRASGGPCVGWINIDKAMTIRGSGSYAGSVTLQAPQGLPCITVAPGVRAVIQDIALASPTAGDAPCISGEEATIALDRVSLRHVGDEAAILVRGGVLDIRSSSINAQTTGPAILVDAGTLTAVGLNVVNAQSGVEISPGPGGPSSLTNVFLTGEHNPSNFGPRAIGVNVRSRRELGELSIVNSRICGYGEGVAVDGVRVTIQGSKLCLADKGVVVYGGELTLTGSRVRARYVGVVAQAGRAVVTNTAFSGVEQIFFEDARGDIDARGNSLWSRGRECSPEFRPEYRGRFVPFWRRGEQGFECQQRPYPQSWWAEEEGALGIAYVNDAYVVPGLNRFNAGCGWYDQRGGFIDDTRYWGEARFGRRNPPLPFASDPRYDRRWVREQERLRERSCEATPRPY